MVRSIIGCPTDERSAATSAFRCMCAVLTVTVVFVTVETGNRQPVPDDYLGVPVYLPARDQAADERRIDLSGARDLFARLTLARSRRCDVFGRSGRFRVHRVHSLSGAATGGR